MSTKRLENPVSATVGGLKYLLLPLILGTLVIVFLLATLRIMRTAYAGNSLDTPKHNALTFVADSTTPTIQITKTVNPPYPDTGGTVSICFTIKRSGLDVALVQDVSGSMNENDVPVEGGGQITRLQASQVAASTFVTRYLQSTDQATVVPFSGTVHIAQHLTVTKEAITEAIADLSADGPTDMSAGITAAHTELITTSPRSGTIKAIILLSDGSPNRPDPGDPQESARCAARAAHTDSIKIYTIGFGSAGVGDFDEAFLKEIAAIGEGEYFFAPNAAVLETVYMSIALELRNLVITDILTPNVETDCSQWPAGWCECEAGSGNTTITLPFSDTTLITNPLTVCFTATADLDPGYEGPINAPGSGYTYVPPPSEPPTFDNPTITVGGRMITGWVFYDLNANGNCDLNERGSDGVTISTNTGLSTATDGNGDYVLRTSSTPILTFEIPGYAITTQTLPIIPPTTGIYTGVDFGIRVPVYLPITLKGYHFLYSDPIINGGFEDDGKPMGPDDEWTGWDKSGSGQQSSNQNITSTNPYSGIFSALLGEPGYECRRAPSGSSWIEQIVRVPPTDSPKLYFRYNIWTYDKNSELVNDYDTFDVEINDELEFRDARRKGKYGCDLKYPEQVNLGWEEGEIDLTAYRDKDITIIFKVRNTDEDYNTWVYIDDVRIDPYP